MPGALRAGTTLEGRACWNSPGSSPTSSPSAHLAGVHVLWRHRGHGLRAAPGELENPAKPGRYFVRLGGPAVGVAGWEVADVDDPERLIGWWKRQ